MMPKWLKSIISEPLLYFLLLALLLSWIVRTPTVVKISPATQSATAQPIVVSRENLERYWLSHPSSLKDWDQSLNPAQFDVQQRQLLRAAYLRDEVLYREALKLQLDKQDELIRQRLSAMMKSVIEGFVATKVVVDEKQLKQYYESRRQEYQNTGADFNAVRALVAQDYRQDQVKRMQEMEITQLLDTYKIVEK